MRESSWACAAISFLARLMRAGMTRVAAYSSKLLEWNMPLLAAVEGEHGLVDGEAGEGLADDRARHAGGLRLAAHRGQEGVEIAAALRGESRAWRVSGKRNEQGGDDHGCDHGRTIARPLIPAQAGIQALLKGWVPAFAGTNGLN